MGKPLLILVYYNERAIDKEAIENGVRFDGPVPMSMMVKCIMTLHRLKKKSSFKFVWTHLLQVSKPFRSRSLLLLLLMCHDHSQHPLFIHHIHIHILTHQSYPYAPPLISLRTATVALPPPPYSYLPPTYTYPSQAATLSNLSARPPHSSPPFLTLYVFLIDLK